MVTSVVRIMNTGTLGRETTFTLSSPGNCSGPPPITANATTGLQTMPPVPDP